MLHLSQLARESENVSLSLRVQTVINPEVYLAENVADYCRQKERLCSPWFKYPISDGRDYAVVIFYNVRLDRFAGGYAYTNVHDASGSEIMCWNERGRLYPAIKSYREMLESGELQKQDWVYRLVVRHSYLGAMPFVAEVTKSRAEVRKEARDSLVDRITALFPERLPDFLPT